MLALTGRSFWQDESYDHLVRHEREFGKIRNYIGENPVRAGLVKQAHEYRWSSAGWAVGGAPADDGADTTVSPLCSCMKTAISIDDELLREADQTAKRLGLSGSRLFARAVDDFLQRQRQDQTLLRLNEVYAGGLDPSETCLLKAIKAKIRPAIPFDDPR